MNSRTVKIGYIPLTDALPLIAAQELGLFAELGLNVELKPEISWSNIRDKLNIGLFDAAHMLAPMLFASRLGLSGVRNPLVTAFSFGLNGNAITVSSELFTILQQSYAAKSGQDEGRALNEVITQRAARGLAPLTFATVFPYSCHWYQLHHWMESAGINLQRDVKLCVLPPEQMVAHMRNGLIDGFCVGEPWNSAAVSEGIGRIIASGVEVWPDAPEKVLATSESWAAKNNDTHAALVQALYQASEWVEFQRSEAVEMLARANIVQLAPEILAQSLVHGIHAGLEQELIPAMQMHIFHRYSANVPQQHHALFLLKQMQQSGQWQGDGRDNELAEAGYLTEFFHTSMNAMASSDTPAA